MGVHDRLRDLGIVLPTPSSPAANYVSAVRTGSLLFVSGHGPARPGDGLVTGKLGRDLSVEEGYAAARLTALACLASVEAAVGLDHVVRFVKLLGMVNATPEFGHHPEVINGASDLLVEVFGEAGRHARSAVGMQSLPRGIAVEIEMIVEVR